MSRTLTFAEYRQHTYEMFHHGRGAEALAAPGCSAERRRLADEGWCGAAEIYCWHSCMSMAAANLTCSKSEAVCANSKNTSLLWPQNYTAPGSNTAGHCMDCTIMCPAAPPPSSTSSFCNTLLGPTTMWMTGFQFAAGNADDPCVVFLFPEWVLDTAGEFSGACIGTFLLGVAVGTLGWVRGHARDAWDALGMWEPSYRLVWRTWAADAALLFIIAVQVCIGCFLMLVAMTYQVNGWTHGCRGAWQHMHGHARRRACCNAAAWRSRIWRRTWSSPPTRLPPPHTPACTHIHCTPPPSG